MHRQGRSPSTSSMPPNRSSSTSRARTAWTSWRRRAGSERIAVNFARVGARYTGVDLSPTALELAASRFQQEGLENVRVVPGSVADLASSESFDFAFQRRDPSRARDRAGRTGVSPRAEARMHSPGDGLPPQRRSTTTSRSAPKARSRRSAPARIDWRRPSASRRGRLKGTGRRSQHCLRYLTDPDRPSHNTDGLRSRRSWPSADVPFSIRLTSKPGRRGADGLGADQSARCR